MKVEGTQQSWMPSIDRNWKTFAIWGALAVGGLLCFKFLRNVTEDHRKVNKIREDIQIAFQIAEQNLCPLTAEKKKVIKDKNLQMHCLFVSNMKKKIQNKEHQMKNPFVPPFQKGKHICDLDPNHRLLFNKFYVLKNHLLIVTKQFTQQTERLTIEDFTQSIYVIRALNGLFFFNCGEHAGYSQNHKHIQVLPQSAFNLPLVARIKQCTRKGQLKLLRIIQRDKMTKLYTYPHFDFIHGIVPLQSSQKVAQVAENLKNAESSLMAYLKNEFKDKDFSYNLIGCEQFLLIVPRKRQLFLNKISLNSVGFMGSFLLKDETIFESIQHIAKPSELLRQLTFTEVQ